MSAHPFFLRPPALVIGMAFCLVFLNGCKTMEEELVERPTLDQPTFVLIDLDKDGKVSPVEMAKYKHQEGLDEFDLDNDRQISATEWTAAKPSTPANDESFKRLDLHPDGKLTEEEAVNFISENPAYREAFKQMDTNGDGYLFWNEYAGGASESLNITLFSTELPAP